MNSPGKLKVTMIALLLAGLCLLSGCGGGTSESIGSAAKPMPETMEASIVPVEPAPLTSIHVRLEGGSGKATVESPAEVQSIDGAYYAVIRWSSPYYDFMVVDGETYLPVNTSGNSVFEIPITGENQTLPVQADTTAMSQPHLIDYTLVFETEPIEKAEEENHSAESPTQASPIPDSLEMTGSMELRYAHEFSLDYCSDGSMLLTVADRDRFLLLPEDYSGEVEDLGEISVLQLPLTNLYIASSSVMDLLREVDALAQVAATATPAESWSIPAICDRVSSGDIFYAGKYSAPDYEQILAAGCPLAVENTMIYHCPGVKEQLESLGIPVLVEHSSYESHPLGRLEWIRLYGILTGHEAEAEAFFSESCAQVEAAEKAATGENGPKTAFFSVSTGGYAVVRSPGDYIVKMIELAGGTYVPEDLPSDTGSHTSTMNLQLEAFYAGAGSADVLIYNGTIEGTMYSMKELDQKSPLFSGFHAVETGNVWCTEQNVFQQTTGIPQMILELRRIFTEGTALDDSELTYFHRMN